MGKKSIGRKTERALDPSSLILYERTPSKWHICRDFQGVPYEINERWILVIEELCCESLG